MRDRSAGIAGLAAVAALLSLVALGNWPYAYYQFLRWAVCGAALAVVFTVNGKYRVPAMVFLIVLAIVYNPITPLHMERESWEVFNVVAAIVLATTSWLVWKKPR